MRLGKDQQENDELYKLLTCPDKNFFTILLENVMIDIGIKEDKRALKNESDINKRRVVTRQIRSRGRGQRTVTKIILNNIQRPFKF